MYASAAFILGAVIGWIRASRFGGNTADKFQYAIAHALALFLLGLVITVFADWQGWV